MPIEIVCLLESPHDPEQWKAWVVAQDAAAGVWSGGSVAGLMQHCGDHAPDVLVVDLAVEGAVDWIRDAHICRPGHHVLALVDAEHAWPAELPAPAAKLKRGAESGQAVAALARVLELARSAVLPVLPRPPSGHVLHRGEAQDEHLEWLQAVPRILVVDDNALILRFAEAALAREFPDHAVITVETGREGMDCARHLHPRLILLDYALPDFNGDSFAEQLRTEADLASIPVVLMSGYGEKLQETAVAHPNVVGTLAKPFRAEEMFQVLRRAMALRPPPPCPHRSLAEQTTRILRQQRPLLPSGAPRSA